MNIRKLLCKFGFHMYYAFDTELDDKSQEIQALEFVCPHCSDSILYSKDAHESTTDKGDNVVSISKKFSKFSHYID